MAKLTDLSADTSLQDADLVMIVDVSNTSMDASGTNLKVLMSNLWAYIKTKADTYYAPVLGADDNYVTDAEKTVIGNTSGTNSGNQTITNSSDATSHTVTLSASGGSVQLIEGTNITLTTGGTGSVGTVTIAATGGSGDVTKVGTPVNNQVGVWTGDGTLEGDTALTFDTTTDTLITGVLNATGLTASELTATDASKNIVSLPVATYPSLTELSYVKGVSSAIQTQIGNKLNVADIDDTPVNGETAQPISSNWAFDHAALASSDTVVGHVELAIASEVNTGTSTSLAVSPDGLAGSYAGTKSLSVQCFEGATDVTTGDGKAYITIPESLNGMNLVRAQATVVTAGTTNATTVMIHNKTDAQDMLSGAISIASAGTVGTVGTVNATYDDVATNDVLRIDVDSVSTTAPKGLMVVLEFRLP